jgi:hypothetical protein
MVEKHVEHKKKVSILLEENENFLLSGGESRPCERPFSVCEINLSD